jgi:hypothetical protein
MTLEKEQRLFFGCKIDSKLREGLAQAKPGDRKYFEGGSDDFLRICDVGEEKWIGKVVKPGLQVTDVEDIQRNIISLLRKIAPDVRQSPSSIKIFALGDREQVIEDEPPREDEQPRGGPYIANY